MFISRTGSSPEGPLLQPPQDDLTPRRWGPACAPAGHLELPSGETEGLGSQGGETRLGRPLIQTCFSPHPSPGHLPCFFSQQKAPPSNQPRNQGACEFTCASSAVTLCHYDLFLWPPNATCFLHSLDYHHPPSGPLSTLLGHCRSVLMDVLPIRRASNPVLPTLIKHREPGPCPMLIHGVWSRTCKFAFLSSSHVSLILLVGD